ncbi:MAG: HlyD family type I secretion periplasmic adaptor subunit, partial [Coxiellaceae bacterium]|nr:HlyD family type I secretion periplasmic adaptor subunit [Coxiellaceae bacterium]
LMVESRIQPRDIGHVRIGDSVIVKITSYYYARYGSINGKLASISATTFDDEEGKPYYKATITLDKQYVGSDKNKLKLKLKAGMTVEAGIVTGEKTLLQYLLKPIHSMTGKSFRER